MRHGPIKNELPPRLQQQQQPIRNNRNTNNGHNSGDSLFSASTSNLRNNNNNINNSMSHSSHSRSIVPPNLSKDLYSQSSGNLKDRDIMNNNNMKKSKAPKSSTVDLLKSLKKKKRKQNQQKHPTQPPLSHHRSTMKKEQQQMSTFKPHHDNLNGPPNLHSINPNQEVGLNLNPANFTVNNLGANIANNNMSSLNNIAGNIGFTPYNNGPNNNPLVPPSANTLGTSIFGQQNKPNPFAQPFKPNHNNNSNPFGMSNNNGNNNPYSLEPNPYSMHNNNKKDQNPPHSSHKFDPNIKEFVPSNMPHTNTNINPKKSKLNANAAEFSIGASTKDDHPHRGSDNSYKQQGHQQHFKLPKPQENFMNNNIKNFDIRNLGPLITDKDILNRDHVKNYDYDFGAALDESHLDIHGQDDNKFDNDQSPSNDNQASLEIPIVQDSKPVDMDEIERMNRERMEEQIEEEQGDDDKPEETRNGTPDKVDENEQELQIPVSMQNELKIPSAMEIETVNINNSEKNEDDDVLEEEQENKNVTIRKSSDEMNGDENKAKPLEIKDNDEQISDDKEDEKNDDDVNKAGMGLIRTNTSKSSECVYYTASSDESSDEDYGKQEWTFDSLWDKVIDIVEIQKMKNKRRDNYNNNWCKWQNIRKLLKCQLSKFDWTYIKDNKLINKIKARFRIEFESDNVYNALMKAGVTDPTSDLPKLLTKQSLRTSEANSFANLKYEQCSIIDLDVRISDIRNYMTELLSNCVPSQYDNVIIAELGQILSIYQKWIDEKKKTNTATTNDDEKEPKPVDRNISNNSSGSADSLMNDDNNGTIMNLDDFNHEEFDEAHGIKQLFGTPKMSAQDIHNIPIDDNTGNGGDYFSRFLDEVHQKALYEHEDHDYPDNDLHDPKDLVMGYIGFLDNCQNDNDNDNHDNKVCDDKPIINTINDTTTKDEDNILVQPMENTHVNNVNEEEDQVKQIPVYNGDIPDEELYDYEYSDESDDEIPIQNHQQQQQIVAADGNNNDDDNKKTQEQCNKDLEPIAGVPNQEEPDDLLTDSVILSETKHVNIETEVITNDVNNVNEDTKQDVNGVESENDNDKLYQYQNGDSNVGLEIFSRVHSPPPRHRNNDEQTDLYANDNENDDNEQRDDGNNDDVVDANVNVNDHHYYNNRYPPRRGRFGKTYGDGNGNYYRQRNQNNQRYNGNSPNPPKMEWKRKEINNNTSDVNGNRDENDNTDSVVTAEDDKQ